MKVFLILSFGLDVVSSVSSSFFELIPVNGKGGFESRS